MFFYAAILSFCAQQDSSCFYAIDWSFSSYFSWCMIAYLLFLLSLWGGCEHWDFWSTILLMSLILRRYYFNKKKQVGKGISFAITVTGLKVIQKCK